MEILKLERQPSYMQIKVYYFKFQQKWREINISYIHLVLRLFKSLLYNYTHL